MTAKKVARGRYELKDGDRVVGTAEYDGDRWRVEDAVGNVIGMFRSLKAATQWAEEEVCSTPS